jgi:hypothetical protein
MTTSDRFTVLRGGTPGEERDERLADGADQLASRRRGSLFGNERFLLALASGLMTFGLCVILLGWLGAAHSTLVEEQVPYLISGGLAGVALALIGAGCLLAHWLTVLIREERARDVVRRQEHAELLAALDARTDRDQREEGADGSAGGTRAQRPIRRAPRSS